MNEIGKFEVQKKKLQGLCDEHGLVYQFCRDKYPITLTIQTTGGQEGQMTMMEGSDGSTLGNPDARLVFVHKDGAVDFCFSENFTISDALFGKLKNLFKNMHALWLQHFFRDIIERGVLTQSQMPQIDDDDVLLDGESLEDLEDDDDFPGELEDDLIAEATRIVRHENKATVSLLQRHMRIGHSKASRLLDALEENGVVGPFNGSDPREVLPHDEPTENEEDADHGEAVNEQR